MNWDMYPASEVILPANRKQPADVGPLARISGPSQVNWDNYRLPEKKDGSLDEANVREMIRGYLACISFVDAQAGIVLDALKAEGLDRNTIVIFWGDHGYHLGEHGEWSKMTNYEEATRVPLIIRDPAAPWSSNPLRRSTFSPRCAICSACPRPRHLEGESLRPLLRGEPGRKKDFAVSLMQRNAAHRWSLGKRERWDAVGWSLRTATDRFNLWLDHERKTPLQREFFHLTTDPGENTNLANDPSHATAMRVLEERLMKEIILPHRQLQSTLRHAATAAESPGSKPKDTVKQNQRETRHEFSPTENRTATLNPACARHADRPTPKSSFRRFFILLRIGWPVGRGDSTDLRRPEGPLQVRRRPEGRHGSAPRQTV